VQMTFTAPSTEVRAWAELLWLQKTDFLPGLGHGSLPWALSHSPWASRPAKACVLVPCPMDPGLDLCPMATS
jgi:hypothetical protein